MIPLLISIGILLLFAFFYFQKNFKKPPVKVVVEVPKVWKSLLQQHVTFYQHLSNEKKYLFEQDVYNFLKTIKVTGIGLEVSLLDRLLVASSGVIPIFGFKEWSYSFLHEVLLYPSHFDRTFNFENPNELITGMVGTGVMEGKMILSQPALVHGFKNTNDKMNVGIHEFVHILDKQDGMIDGVPQSLHENEYAMPWLVMVKGKIQEIHQGRSDINDYGGTNNEEFFAVVSEYFFERPHLLQKKHPQLYQALVLVFKQDLAAEFNIKNRSQPVTISRNSLCPCGSGLKYKRCCID